MPLVLPRRDTIIVSYCEDCCYVTTDTSGWSDPPPSEVAPILPHHTIWPFVSLFCNACFFWNQFLVLLEQDVDGERFHHRCPSHLSKSLRGIMGSL